MTFVTIVLLFVVGAAWLAGIVALMFKAADVGDDYGWRRGVLWGLAPVLLFALPFAIAAQQSGNDAYANTLCLSGHEEWRTSRRSATLVGKVVIPGGTSTYKVWVCERWEQ